jgi:hypothetical protein
MESPSSAFSQLRVRALRSIEMRRAGPWAVRLINLQELAHEAFHCYGIKKDSIRRIRKTYHILGKNKDKLIDPR